MKILLTGGTGQLGTERRPRLSVLGEVIAPGRTDLDLCRLDAASAFGVRMADWSAGLRSCLDELRR